MKEAAIQRSRDKEKAVKFDAIEKEVEETLKETLRPRPYEETSVFSIFDIEKQKSNLNKAGAAFGKLGPVAAKLSGMVPSVWPSDIARFATQFATVPPTDTVNAKTGDESTNESQIEVMAGYGKIINWLVTIAGQGVDIYNKMDQNRQEARF